MQLVGMAGVKKLRAPLFSFILRAPSFEPTFVRLLYRLPRPAFLP